MSAGSGEDAAGVRGRGDAAVGETCGGRLQGVRVEVEQLDRRVRGRVGGVLEVPAGSGADVEVPATEVGVVVREQAFAGAAPDEGVAPPHHDGVVQRQIVWGGAGLLRLRDLTCRHACSPSLFA